MRRLLPALLVIPALLVTPAHAEKAGCQTTDPVGDATGLAAGQKLTFADSAMDFRYVALATDATRLKVEVGLDQIVTNDAYALTGRQYVVSIAAKGPGVPTGPKTITFTIDPQGVVTSQPVAIAANQLVLDAAGKTMSVVVRLSTLGFQRMRPSTVRPRRTGDPFVSVTARSYRLLAGSPVGDPVDEAQSGANPVYVHRAASCVKF